MLMTFALALQAASAPLPTPLTETHMRDIGCVATLGIVADEQRRGFAPSTRFPNIMTRGKTWAGIVGERVMTETGQPREVVALAINQAVNDQQARSANAADNMERRQIMDAMMAKCLPLLDAEVAAEQPTPDDYRFCAAIIALAADEIEGREGTESVNALAMRGLAANLEDKFVAASSDGGDDIAGRASAAADLVAEKAKQQELAKEGGGLEALSETEGEEKYQRCIFLGD